MNLVKLFISFYLLSYTYSKILTKYGTLEIDSDFVVFESKDFKDDEEMYFKIKSTNGNFYNIIDHFFLSDLRYYYTDSDGNKKGNDYYNAFFKKQETEDGYDINYFTITKRRSEYIPSNGDYIKIEFGLSTLWAIITNTEEDEGKMATWIIVVIVVVVVAIIAGIVIFFVCRCIRKRKALAEVDAARANMAAQNQVYTAQINQNAYLAGQNYQAQAYQAQVFQNPVNISPGIPPDMGYNSKAVM